MRDHSQQAMRAIASAKTAHTPAGAKKSIPRTTGRIASAVMTRVSSKVYPAWVAGSDWPSCSLVRPKRRSRRR